LKTIKSKLLINLFFFLLLGSSGIVIIDIINLNRQNYSLNAQSKLIETQYKNNYKNFKVMTHEFSLMFQNNKQLTDLLFEVNGANTQEKELLRKQIYTLLLKDFQRLQKIGISQIHFYAKDNSSFLRMKHSEIYEDTNLTLKTDVIRTNTNQTIQEGYKISKYASGVKFSYPLFDKYHQYISGIEITYATTSMMQNMLTEFTYDLHILVANHLLDERHRQCEINKKCEQGWESPAYHIDSTTHKIVRIMNLYHTLKEPELQKKIAKKLQAKSLFSLPVVHNYTDLVITFLPLQNISGEPSDIYLVAYTQSDYLSELILENKYLLILFFSFLLLTFIFISYILISRDKFEQLALYDNVTGLANRSLFLIELNNDLKKATRYEHKLALLFIDLDGFKAVNDTYGHQIGDELLQYCASSFSRDVRSSDMVARIGGDEFVIILNNIEQNDISISVANKIIRNISKKIYIHHHEIQIGASIGVAIYPEHAHNEENLIKLADDMMYQSKKNGKNRVTIFEKL